MNNGITINELYKLKLIAPKEEYYKIIILTEKETKSIKLDKKEFKELYSDLIRLKFDKKYNNNLLDFYNNVSNSKKILTKELCENNTLKNIYVMFFDTDGKTYELELRE